jgi:hypothetical protein
MICFLRYLRGNELRPVTHIRSCRPYRRYETIIVACDVSLEVPSRPLPSLLDVEPSVEPVLAEPRAVYREITPFSR